MYIFLRNNENIRSHKYQEKNVILCFGDYYLLVLLISIINHLLETTKKSDVVHILRQLI